MSVNDRPTRPPTPKDEEEILEALTLPELILKILNEHKLEEEDDRPHA